MDYSMYVSRFVFTVGFAQNPHGAAHLEYRLNSLKFPQQCSEVARNLIPTKICTINVVVRKYLKSKSFDD